MIIKKGMKGAHVMEIQSALGITIDGDFGPKTEKAVKDFQKKNGLTVDGIVGRKTLDALGIKEKSGLSGVRVYETEELLKRVKSLKDFNGIPEGYWIIGVRNLEDLPDRFDDRFFLMKDDKLIMTTTGTTNPGLKIIKGGFRKYNKDGAAVVESDRIYYGVWKYGKHLGYMPALKQLGAAITVYRDGDMDHLSEEVGKKTTGWYGINFHTATKSYLGNIIKSTIGGWSAGCQVCNNTTEYMKIINTIKNSKQEKVTYCLLKEFE
jgi:peptidoglycan hydrolase-like protein with peptidoglycan-binding domain